MATTTTKEQLVEAISATVAEFRKYIDAHNGDIDTPREEIIENLKEFFSELNRRFDAQIRVIDGGFATTIGDIEIEFLPKAEFIRIGRDELVSTRVGGDSDSAAIHAYIEECMNIALWGVLI